MRNAFFSLAIALCGSISAQSAQLCTQFGGIAGWTGAVESAFYYDINVIQPAGITVTQLGVQIQNPGVAVTINVYLKSGSHVGHEGNRDAWALVATGAGVGTGTPMETVVDVTDFSLNPGQWSLAIGYTLPTSQRFNYTTSGPTTASNSDIQLSNGAMWAPAFVGNTRFSPRNWNGCIYYDIAPLAGSFWVVGEGCRNSTGQTAALGFTGAYVPTAGTTMNFQLSDAPSSQPISFVMFGFADLPGIDLGLIGMTGCRLFVNPTFTMNAPTDASGIGTASLAIPAATALALPFWAQGFIVDAGTNPFGAVVSNAITGRIGM